MPRKNQRKKTPASQEEKKLCAFCNKTAELKCTGCYKVYYCNKEHQTLDWKNHDKNCSALKLVEDESSGRKYYVARRDIEANELVYVEKEPLVVGPAIRKSDVIKCLSCYAELTKETANPCKTCGWPLCPDCKTHGPECEVIGKFFKMTVSSLEYKETGENYEYIIGLRALALRTRNPSAYDKLMKLRDRATTGSFQEFLVKTAYENYQGLNSLKLKEDTSIFSELAKIYPVLLCYSHDIVIKENALVAVYENVFFFKHSCVPYCTKYISDVGGISIVANTPISKGQNVTICHVELRLPAILRRECLTSHHIFCQCERCDDPSEFGTMYNTVKCTRKDCDGYMLPPTFISEVQSMIRCLDDVNYVCDKCNRKVSSITIKDIEIKTLQKLEKLNRGRRRDVCKLKTVLEERRKLVHEGHFSIFDVKVELAILIGAEDNLKRTSNELLMEKIQYCSETVFTFEKIMPSDRVNRATLLFHLYLGLKEWSLRMALMDGRVEALGVWDDCAKVLASSHELLRSAAVYEDSIADLIADVKREFVGSDQLQKTLLTMLIRTCIGPSIFI